MHSRLGGVSVFGVWVELEVFPLILPVCCLILAGSPPRAPCPTQ